MTQEEMNQFIRNDYPVTYNSVKVTFKNGTHDVGFFTDFSEDFNSSNKWRFVPSNSSSEYQKTKSLEHTKIIDGDTVDGLNI